MGQHEQQKIAVEPGREGIAGETSGSGAPSGDGEIASGGESAPAPEQAAPTEPQLAAERTHVDDSIDLAWLIGLLPLKL